MYNCIPKSWTQFSLLFFSYWDILSTTITVPFIHTSSAHNIPLLDIDLSQYTASIIPRIGGFGLLVPCGPIVHLFVIMLPAYIPPKSPFRPMKRNGVAPNVFLIHPSRYLHKFIFIYWFKLATINLAKTLSVLN